MSRETQCSRVLRHLLDTGSITSAEAMQEYGVMRLAARINDLRRQGYPIETEILTGKNRYGDAVKYARYSMEKEPPR